MLISIETHITCDFTGGPDPLSILDPHMGILPPPSGSSHDHFRVCKPPILVSFLREQGRCICHRFKASGEEIYH